MSFQSPIVSFDGIGYEITFFRAGASGAMKEVKETFGDHSLRICAAPEATLASWQRSQIKGPVSNDGQLYYLRACSNDILVACYIWLQNKEEAIALRKAIDDAESSGSRPDTKCTFCGDMDSVCGGDHGDEMRDWQREALERD